MTDYTIKDLAMLYAEDAALFKLIPHVFSSADDRGLRVITGSTLSTIGYLYGPSLYDRVRKKDLALSPSFSNDVVYAAGGAALGALAGYKIGSAAETRLPPRVKTVLEQMEHPRDKDQRDKLAVAASIGWLAYRFLLAKKTPEEQRKHRWGLGAGVVGYAIGPSLIHRLEGFTAPKDEVDDVLRTYTIGTAMMGGVVGGIAGLRNAEFIGDYVKKFRTQDPQSTTPNTSTTNEPFAGKTEPQLMSLEEIARKLNIPYPIPEDSAKETPASTPTQAPYDMANLPMDLEIIAQKLGLKKEDYENKK